jgi:hypothetical protein
MKQVAFYILSVSLLSIGESIDRATDPLGVASPLFWLGSIASFLLLVCGLELYARKGRVFAPESSK